MKQNLRCEYDDENIFQSENELCETALQKLMVTQLVKFLILYIS
jgi:hypothetical protein